MTIETKKASALEKAAELLPEGWALNVRFEGGHPDSWFVEAVCHDNPEIMARYRKNGKTMEKKILDAAQWAQFKQRELTLESAARSRAAKTKAVELMEILTGKAFKFDPDSMDEALGFDLVWRALKARAGKLKEE